MRIDLSSMMFNMPLKVGGGTSSWGTSLGQGTDHKLDFAGSESIIVGMVYSKTKKDDEIYCPLGKGGNKQDDYEYVLSAKFDKIYVNKVLIPDASFVLLIVKQLVANATQHIGRRTLKYSPKITFNKKTINQDCIDKIIDYVGLNNDSAWFVSDIDIVNQDELHFTIKIVDKDNKKEFEDSSERKKFIENRANKTEKIDNILVDQAKEASPEVVDFSEPIVLTGKTRVIDLNRGIKNGK